ncbi:MAG: hypothetical protein QXU93_08000 [Thermoproteus sp.]
MRSIIPVILLLAAFAAASVYVSESGDTVYFATPSSFGAMDALGNTLWSIPALNPLIATDPMGSCLAVAFPFTNLTQPNMTVSGTVVELVVGRQPLWFAFLKNFNATAIATDCVHVAVGSLNGYVVLQNGKVVQNVTTGPITSLAYTLSTHSLVYATWQPGRFSWTDWCADNLTVVKTNMPILYVNGQPYFGGFGFGDLMRPAFAVSEKCDLSFAVGNTVYWRGRAIRLNDTVTAVGLSGSGDVLAVGTMGGEIYVYVNGSLAATIPYGSVPRQLSLSYNGLTLAVDGDNGPVVYRFQVANVSVVGCNYGLVKAGFLTYRVPGLVFMPYGSQLTPLEVDQLAWRCVPLAVQGYTVYYQKQYAVALYPPAQGPTWAVGVTQFSAPPTKQAQLLCNAPFCPQQITETFVGWRINGTEKVPALPTIALYINGPTSVEPLYSVQVPTNITQGGVRYVLKYYVNLSASGLPVAENPDIVQAYYNTYFLVAVQALDNFTARWFPAGSTVVIEAPQTAGNDTVRYVFVGWANVSANTPNATVTVNSPISAVALYNVYYKVVWSAPWKNATQWVPAGSTVTPPNIPPYQTADTRGAVVGWQLNGQQINSYTANAPAVITAQVAWTYLVTMKYPWGAQEQWLPQGYPLPTPPSRYDLVFVFKGWEPSPTVVGPGVYTAVYELDVETVALLGAVAAGAVGAYLFSRKR